MWKYVLAVAIALSAAAMAQARAALVQDVNQQLRMYGVAPEEVVNVGGTLFFRGCADDGLTGCELWKYDGTAAGPVLVKDLFPGVGSSRITSLTDVNGTLFFAANDPGHADRLWKSDGTPEGTVRVADVGVLNCPTGPGSCGRAPLTAVGDLVFFASCTVGSECELWKSDGTMAGTARVKDINPSGGSFPTELTAVDGMLFFVACAAYAAPYTSDCGVWRSDGTEAGTVHLAVSTYLSSPRELTDVSGTLFFMAPGGLWKSDGTPEGTVEVKEGGGGSELTSVGGTLFFNQVDAVTGHELGKSDGTEAGTVLVKDIAPGTESSAPGLLTDVGGTLFFVVDFVVDGDGTNVELWKSDGTPTGTVLLKQFAEPLSDLTSMGGVLYFGAGSALWRSDGTTAGTVMVKDSLSPTFLTDRAGTLWFWGNRVQLWTSDGTAPGTVLVADAEPGTWSSNPRFVTNRDGVLYFVADDGQHGGELWRSDGTAAGTSRITDLPTGSILAHVEAGATHYLFTYDGEFGEELWKTDGTAAGTVFVTSVGATLTYLEPWIPFPPTAMNGEVYFASKGTDNPLGYELELWKSDGTTEGTVRLMVFPRSYPDPYGPPYWQDPLTNPVVMSGMFYFFNDTALWRSDGTEAGTQLVTGLGAPINMRSVDTTLYISTSGSSSSTLWRSDGTAAGTVALGTFRSYTSAPRWFANVGSTLFFAASGSYGGELAGVELWKSDGTVAGTALVKDIRPGGSSQPEFLTEAGGVLYFAADDGTNGRELWRSDGTAAGTVLARDINPGPGASLAIAGGAGYSAPPMLRSVNGVLYFTANDGVHGYEAWRATGHGIGLVADVFLGQIGSGPAEFTALGSAVVFSAFGEGVGSELWIVRPARSCGVGAELALILIAMFPLLRNSAKSPLSCC